VLNSPVASIKSSLFALSISFTWAELNDKLSEWIVSNSAGDVNSILFECDVGSPNTNLTSLLPSVVVIVDILNTSLTLEPNAFLDLEKRVINSESILKLISYSGSAISGVVWIINGSAKEYWSEKLESSINNLVGTLCCFSTLIKISIQLMIASFYCSSIKKKKFS
jgi:hypothetical protein